MPDWLVCLCLALCLRSAVWWAVNRLLASAAKKGWPYIGKKSTKDGVDLGTALALIRHLYPSLPSYLDDNELMALLQKRGYYQVAEMCYLIRHAEWSHEVGWIDRPTAERQKLMALAALIG